MVSIVGPTASGKTGLAVSLAERFQGEIINADSRQVYRYLDIGTAKPTAEEQRQAPHHLLDLLNPDQDFSLGAFLSLAKNAVEDLHRRDRMPLLVGGTGQYILAFLEGWNVPEIPPDEDFRRAKEQEAEDIGPVALHQQLEAIDPQRANQLDYRNVRRVIRALEIYHVTGQKPSAISNRTPPVQDSLVIGLTLERQELYARIDRRVDNMMAAGFLDEVRRLSAMGYLLGTGPLDSLGYRELGQHLSGELDLDEAVQRTKFQTHRLARRQYSWFKLTDPRIHWLDAADPALETDASRLIEDYLRQGHVVQ
ncbi:MAG: tRNA (adenosine(37)-N6)-dimethylallyltransferase MiaA [Chloroflexi bacterium]|nr:tRNA (adenosine(37)-N6)-dimethylallyltransferase MiaA [Chloroflexota bacterium]